MRQVLPVVVAALLFSQCGPSPCPAGECAQDSGPNDAGRADAGAFDAGAFDAGTIDAGPIDAGERDAGAPDAGPADAGVQPEKLTFLTSPQTLGTASCSAVLTVQLQTAGGTVVNASQATTITLTSSSAGGVFFSDPACLTAASSIEVGAGSASASFHYRDSTAGASVVTAASPGLTSAVQTQTVTTAIPETNCSNSLDDDSDGLVDCSDPDCNASSCAANGRVCSAAACTCSGNGGVAQSAESSCGDAFDNDCDSLVDCGDPDCAAACAPSGLAFISPAQVLLAGACSAPLTVQAQTAAGAPANVTAALSISTSSSAGVFFGDAACSSPVNSVNLVTGNSSVSFHYRDPTPGSSTLTASSPSLTPATLVQTISAGPPASLEFTTAAQSLVQGACSGVATVRMLGLLRSGPRQRA